MVPVLFPDAFAQEIHSLRNANAVQFLICSYVGCSRNSSREANFLFHCVQLYGGIPTNIPEMEPSTFVAVINGIIRPSQIDL